MPVAGLAFFDTALGLCGIAWSDRGITAVQLPEASSAATRRRIRERLPGVALHDPPGFVQQAIDGIVELLERGTADLNYVALDLEGVGEFERRVYDAIRKLPPGVTTTYGELASSLGDAGAARAVGQALGRNPVPVIVPCHRVLAAGDRPGGFSASGGVLTKMKLLAIEKADAARQKPLFD